LRRLVLQEQPRLRPRLPLSVLEVLAMIRVIGVTILAAGLVLWLFGGFQ
jgi:hypothetical protein